MPINISSRFHSVAEEKIVAPADEIYDEAKQKRQSQINAEVTEAVEDLTEAISTKQPAITTVQVDVDDQVGEPTGSASIEGGTINLSFQNLKGEPGEKGETGAEGPQGATAVYDSSQQYPPFTFDTKIGTSQTAGMTQAAISDAIQDFGTEEWASATLSNKTKLKYASGALETNSSANYKVYYMQVSERDALNITPAVVANKEVYVMVSDVEPAAGAVRATSVFTIPSDGEAHRYYAVRSGYLWICVTSGQNVTATKAVSKTEALEGRVTEEVKDSGRAVKSELYDINYDKSEKMLTTAASLAINVETNKIATSSAQSCYYAAVEEGDVLLVMTTLSDSKYIRVGFTSAVPANGVDVTGVQQFGLDSTFMERVTAPADGYIVVNHATASAIEDKVYILTKKAADMTDSLLMVTGTEGKAVSAVTGKLVDNASTIATNFVNVDGLQYVIYQRFRHTSSSTNMGMAFYSAADENTMVSSQTFKTSQPDFGYEETKLTIPAGAKYARFTYYITYKDDFYIKVPMKAVTDKESVIYPKIYMETLRGSNGDFSHPSYLDVAYSTIKYIQCTTDFGIKASVGYAHIFYYGKDFGYLGNSGIVPITSGQYNQFPVMSGTEYIKVSLYNDSAFSEPYTSQPTISLKGYFGREAFNVRTSDGGYHRLIVPVMCTDPSSTDEKTNTVQDNPVRNFDFGVIALPETYDPIGEPTRLIIYCHGAGVNYADTATRFSSNDLEPDYWLAEGYAVMDVEGNPYDNENEHFHIPQAMDCYIAAYKWAIEHYNLKRDGVFLGGRSMGGANTFSLIRNDCPIPVIAACPNVPACMATLTWNYMSGERRAFCAEHMGFKNQPSSWTSTSPMPAAEWNCLKENFDRLVQFWPFLAMISELPSVDEIFADSRNKQFNTSDEHVDDIVMGLRIKAKVPVKIFVAEDDTVAIPRRCAYIWFQVLKNGGSRVEMRRFTSGDHRYDIEPGKTPAQRIHRCTVTTRFGVEMTQVPIVYVEMLRFWQRFEQE